MDTERTLSPPDTFEECTNKMMPVHEVLAQIGGKWTVYIIGALSQGPQRFSELKRHIEGISQKMLTATLRDLERDGFVIRRVTPSIPPRVDYELTDMGRELREPLQFIGTWAHANRARVEAARHSFALQQEEQGARGW